MAKIHYKGDLGEFNYDSKEFVILDNDLIYIGKETDGNKIHIPEGILYCDFIFANTNIETPPVIPEGVITCRGLFMGCESLKTAPVIPQGVRYTEGMFCGCKNLKTAPVIPKSVEYSYFMFDGCSSDTRKEASWNLTHRGKCKAQRGVAR